MDDREIVKEVDLVDFLSKAFNISLSEVKTLLSQNGFHFYFPIPIEIVVRKGKREWRKIMIKE